MSLTSISKAAYEFSDFSVTEWHRLDNLALLFDRALKTAYLRTVTVGYEGSTFVKDVITDCVVETGVGTAHVYGMTFDAKSPRYQGLIDSLNDTIMSVVVNENAKTKVKEILPSGLSLSERNDRLRTFGLSAQDAVRLERMRQKGITGRRLEDTRLHMCIQRGNLIALTEVNRIINQTLETVWLDNMTVSKASKSETSEMYLEHAGTVTAITSIRGIPARAKKMIVTRRDNRVCDYCFPLERATAKIGSMFNTRYGLFPHPPFHPRCRCYMIVSY